MRPLNLPCGKKGSVFEHARAVCLLCDAHFYGICRQDVVDQLRPLEETEGAAVEIIFVAHVVDFFKAFDAIEVEVEDRGSVLCGVIFVDDGESGRGDDVFYAEFLAKGFDKSGFPGTHFAVKGEHFARSFVGNELPGGVFDVCEGMNDDLHDG